MRKVLQSHSAYETHIKKRSNVFFPSFCVNDARFAEKMRIWGDEETGSNRRACVCECLIRRVSRKKEKNPDVSEYMVTYLHVVRP